MQRRPSITVWTEALPGRRHLVLRWHDRDGHQRQRSAGTANRRDAARAAAALEIELAAAAGRRPATTWEAFARAYEIQHAAGLAPATRNHWHAVLATLDDFGPPAELDDLDSAYLSRWLAWLTRPADARERAHSPATAASYRKRLAHALRWAAERGYLERPPRIPAPPKIATSDRARGRPLAAEEFDRLRSAPLKLYPARTAKALRRLLRGLWTGGLRLGETLDMNWDDPAHIMPRDLDHPTRKPTLAIPAGRQKSRRAETIPCPPELAELLRTCPPDLRRGPIFRIPGQHGRPIRSTSYIERLIARAGRRAGIIVHRYANGAVKHASAHDLRRSFAQRWADRGLSELELAAIMRHRSIETTRQFYLHTNEQHLAQRLADLANEKPTP